jgi:hypothetical protein
MIGFIAGLTVGILVAVGATFWFVLITERRERYDKDD